MKNNLTKWYYIGIVLIPILAIPLCKDNISEEILEYKDWDDNLINASMQLMDELKSDPHRQQNWEALFHYKSITDGGMRTDFYRDSFLLFFTEKPMLLWEQYKETRDSRVLRLLQEMIYGYSPDLYGRKEESYPAKKMTLKSVYKMISQLEDSDEKRVFLEVMRDYIPLYRHGDGYQTLASRQMIEQVKSGNWVDDKWNLLTRLLYNELRIGGDTFNEREALFLYENSLTPDEMPRFYQNCFFLYFDENPYLLYRRYAVTGDARLLALGKRLVEWHDPVVMNHQGASGEYKKTRVVEAIDMIKKEKPSTERELEFLQTIESTWEQVKTKYGID